MGLIDKFFGKKSMSFVEVVELTSVDMFANALSQVESLIENNVFSSVLGTDPKKFNKAAYDLVVDLMSFSLHLADRCAFNNLSPIRREKFINELMMSVSDNLSQTLLRNFPSEKQLEFRFSFLRFYSSRAEILAKFDIPEKDDPFTLGGVFAEAAELSATDMFTSDAESIFTLTFVFAGCLNGIKNLHLRLGLIADW